MHDTKFLASSPSIRLGYRGLSMSLIRRATVVAILGFMFLGIASLNAQVSTELPQSKSGASVNKTYVSQDFAKEILALTTAIAQK
jgi:hypothetical protein